MQTHHRIAVSASLLAVAALAVDTVVFVRTGERTVVTDDARLGASGRVASALALCLVFGLLAWVVARERSRFAAAPRLTRWSRRPLLVGLVVLAAGFGLLSPALIVAGFDEGPLYDASGLVAALALATMFVGALGTGLGTLRRNPLGVGGRLLSLIAPVLAATAVLAVLEPRWASPVYTTAVVLVGVSLLGVRAGSAQPATRAAMASPTAEV
jgi:hypothetical protein